MHVYDIEGLLFAEAMQPDVPPHDLVALPRWELMEEAEARGMSEKMTLSGWNDRIHDGDNLALCESFPPGAVNLIIAEPRLQPGLSEFEPFFVKRMWAVFQHITNSARGTVVIVAAPEHEKQLMRFAPADLISRFLPWSDAAGPTFALYECLIHELTEPADTVLVPFDGCDRALMTASGLWRRGVGIESAQVGAMVARQRLTLFLDERVRWMEAEVATGA